MPVHRPHQEAVQSLTARSASTGGSNVQIWRPWPPKGLEDRSGEPLAALMGSLRNPKVPKARNTRVAPRAASDAKVAAFIAKYERAEPWNGATSDARQQAYLEQCA